MTSEQLDWLKSMALIIVVVTVHNVSTIQCRISIRLTRTKPRAHQKQGPMQPPGEGDVEGPKEARSLEALPWVNTALQQSELL